jgi:hypothetical protein
VTDSAPHLDVVLTPIGSAAPVDRRSWCIFSDISNAVHCELTARIRNLERLHSTIGRYDDQGPAGTSACSTNHNDGDETYVRVPASKEFYVFTTSIIEPDRASVGAYGQDAKAQTLWEQVKAAKAGSQQNGISTELKQMLNDMAQRQSQLEQLKSQAAASPSAPNW